MSTFLDDLLLRNLGEEAVIRPRLPARFEAEGAGVGAGEQGSVSLAPTSGESDGEARQLPTAAPPVRAQTYLPEPAQPVAVERRRVPPVEERPVAPRQPVTPTPRVIVPGAVQMEPSTESVQPQTRAPVVREVERTETAQMVEPLTVTPPALSPAPEPSPMPAMQGNAPLAPKEPPRETGAPSPVSVRVHIGRVEVQTPTPAPRPEPQRMPAARTAAPLRPAVSLDQYLTRRGRRS